MSPWAMALVPRRQCHDNHNSEVTDNQRASKQAGRNDEDIIPNSATPTIAVLVSILLQLGLCCRFDSISYRKCRQCRTHQQPLNCSALNHPSHLRTQHFPRLSLRLAASFGAPSIDRSSSKDRPVRQVARCSCRGTTTGSSHLGTERWADRESFQASTYTAKHALARRPIGGHNQAANADRSGPNPEPCPNRTLAAQSPR